MKRVGRGLTLFALLLVGCRRAEPLKVEPAKEETASTSDSGRAELIGDRWSEQGMLAEGERFVSDTAFRRATLVASLANAKNTYSRQRLESYGLGTKGWDLLPEWNPKSVPATLASLHSPIDPETPPLWDGKRPAAMPQWIALGREVFFRYPLRVEVYMRWALEHPDAGARVGVHAAPNGEYPGVVSFIDVDGKSAIGITCAICHSTVESGDVVVGEARRAFDYGALRLAYHADTKKYVDPELARRMKTWGPGRADVTEDDDEDPVAIPDLWGLRHQSFLTQAGTIKQVGPSALAIRQETQLLHSNHQKVRPPRELAYALAMYLYSLAPPEARATKDDKTSERGRSLFEKSCRGCHSNDAFGGEPVAAEKVATDRSLALGAARGTGTYRPPALLRVSAAAPYFHHGAVPTLEDVLSPDRLSPTYARSPLGKGAVAGHTYGTDLSAADRAAVVSYLRTL